MQLITYSKDTAVAGGQACSNVLVIWFRFIPKSLGLSFSGHICRYYLYKQI